MDSTPDDPVAELLALAHGIRAQLVRRARLGAWAMPGGASPGPARSPVALASSEPEVQLERGRIELPVFDETPRTSPRTLAEIRAELGDCTRCNLATTRRSIVFGVGAADAPLVFVGEAPGEQEDRRGEPFVGPAGELLDKMIEAMGWTRQSVYITNTVMCRPPDNRDPQPDELGRCMPFLHAKLGVIAPRVIVALGRPAANNLLGTDAPISTLRGTFHDRHGARIMATFHPAFLLRDPERKRDTWSDLKLVIAELERLGVAPPNPPRG